MISVAIRSFSACFLVGVLVLTAGGGRGEDQPRVTAEKLLAVGKTLVDRSHYLEALDLFNEARALLEREGGIGSALYADILYMSAEAKIKGRLHQGFPALYVKTAIEDVQTANTIREGISGILPQKLAEGYYLEGMIHKRFFMRTEHAKSCFWKAVNVDSGHVAARRELSEAVAQEKENK